MRESSGVCKTLEAKIWRRLVTGHGGREIGISRWGQEQRERNLCGKAVPRTGLTLRGKERTEPFDQTSVKLKAKQKIKGSSWGQQDGFRTCPELSCGMFGG